MKTRNDGFGRSGDLVAVKGAKTVYETWLVARGDVLSPGYAGRLEEGHGVRVVEVDGLAVQGLCGRCGRVLLDGAGPVCEECAASAAPGTAEHAADAKGAGR
jgi:hypothetical protein